MHFIGVVAVMAAFTVAIDLSELPLEVFGVALVSDGFGGVGRGAMLGATLAAVRVSDHHR